MKLQSMALVGIAVLALTGAAHAGPCTTANGKMQDAGAGPTPGNTGQAPTTTGSATGTEHPPTRAMSEQAPAASSQDTHRQNQGQPTAVQQGAGMAKNDQGC